MGRSFHAAVTGGESAPGSAELGSPGPPAQRPAVLTSVLTTRKEVTTWPAPTIASTA